MAAGTDHQSQRSYEDFEPSCKWHELENVVDVHLQGFKKEHLSVRTTSSGMLVIHGERPSDKPKSKWIRFNKEIKLPTNCDTNKVAAKFSGGTLTITMPPKDAAVRPVPPQVHDQARVQAQSQSPDTRTNNDKAIVKLVHKIPDNTSGATDKNAAALHDEDDDATRTSACPRSLATNSRFKFGKYHIAVKLVLVAAVMVGVGLGAYVKYIKPSYSLEDMD